MCLAIPGQVVEMDSKEPLLAKVDVSGVRRNVNVGLLEEAALQPGDWILIHVGFALSKIGEEEAQDQLRMLRAMGEDELAIEEIRGYTFDADGDRLPSGSHPDRPPKGDHPAPVGEDVAAAGAPR